ncbi:unnamed protein product [Peronospora farinosa]|uniref:DNA-directed DNA polymerase n=2 Tax=Peronospora farinosa TaxID=134698 RepID=A0AAV0U4L4_9STRA|nr:unnamed protein product [Peronospora farinosa]
MPLGTIFKVGSAAYELTTVVTDVILNYEYINRNWLEEYYLSIAFLVFNGIVMGFVGLRIDVLYPNRFSTNKWINKVLGFGIGLLQMRVFVETIFTVSTSIIKSTGGNKQARSQDNADQDDNADWTWTHMIAEDVGGKEASEEARQRTEQLEDGKMYATFIQVIVRDIPLFILQANATIHYRKWQFIDIFTVITTFVSLMRGTAAYVAKEDGAGLKVLAFVFLIGQFVFRLGAILLLAMTKGLTILVFGSVITLFAILSAVKLSLANESRRFVDQLHAVILFPFFALFVVDGSKLDAQNGSSIPALRSNKLVYLHLWRCVENIVGIVLAVVLPRYTDFGVSYDATIVVIGVICAAIYAATGAQKRDYFDQIEELLHPPQRRRSKTDIAVATDVIGNSNGTRRQVTNFATIFENKRRPTTEGTPKAVDMRNLEKHGALQQDKRPAERKIKGPAKKSKLAANTGSLDISRTLLLHGKRILLIPLGPDMGRKRLEILRGIVLKLGGNVVETQVRTSARSGNAAAMKLNDINIIIASAQLKHDKAAQFLHVAKFPPPNVEVYTPEWIVYLLQKKKLPSPGILLTWAEQQQVQDEAVKHEQHCADVAQLAEEKRAQNKSNRGESDSDEGSNSENSDTREIVRAPPVAINSENFREQQGVLNEKNKKLVEERTPIFYKNNPGFRPINEGATSSSKKVKGEGFICQRTSAIQQNLNAHLTDPLEEMMEYLDVERDVWRHYMYKKVVSSLKATRYRVCSVKDFKDMQWVKGRLRDKVIEILETGRLAKLDAKKSNSRLRALVEIARIWGVGPVTAAKFYGMGYKTVADLRNPEATEMLTAQQKIGVKHYEDFLTKIPRAEVQQIEQAVVEEVHKMIPNAIALACGSYRRGKLASGDCDILVTDPDANSCDILPELLERLHASGFLTGNSTRIIDDLTHFRKQKTGGCDTYMGVCRVSKDLPYRRLDIKIYPRHFFGFAMLYFTGSDHFNRSMRLFAHKNGWSLSDRALTRVMRANGTTVRLGDSVICESEVDVFIALGLEYKDPTERNCFDIKFLDEDEAKVKRQSKRSVDDDDDGGE